MANSITVIAHDIRSCHNVGSLFRTADCLGVETVYLTGYTPYPPKAQNDPRLPFEQKAAQKAINKTALGAEETVVWYQNAEIQNVIKQLKKEGYTVVGLEQTATSIDLASFLPLQKTALVLGNEVNGLSEDTIKLLDLCVEIPMRGQKESLNVVQASAIAMYHCV